MSRVPVFSVSDINALFGCRASSEAELWRVFGLENLNLFV